MICHRFTDKFPCGAQTDQERSQVDKEKDIAQQSQCFEDIGRGQHGVFLPLRGMEV